MQLVVQTNHCSKKIEYRQNYIYKLSPHKLAYDQINFTGGYGGFDYERELKLKLSKMSWVEKKLLGGKKQAENETTQELIEFRLKICESEEKRIESLNKNLDLKNKDLNSKEKLIKQRALGLKAGEAKINVRIQEREQASNLKISQNEQASAAKIAQREQNMKSAEEMSSEKIRENEQRSKAQIAQRERDSITKILRNEQASAAKISQKEETSQRKIIEAEQNCNNKILQREQACDARIIEKEHAINLIEEEKMNNLFVYKDSVDKKNATAVQIKKEAILIKEEALQIKEAAIQIKKEAFKMKEDALKIEENSVLGNFNSLFNKNSSEKLIKEKIKALNEKETFFDKYINDAKEKEKMIECLRHQIGELKIQLSSKQNAYDMILGNLNKLKKEFSELLTKIPPKI